MFYQLFLLSTDCCYECNSINRNNATMEVWLSALVYKKKKKGRSLNGQPEVKLILLKVIKS